MSTEPYTLKRYAEFRKKLYLGEMTADGVRAEWAAVKEGRAQIFAEFKAMKKAQLVQYAGWHYANDTKDRLVAGAFNSLCFVFSPDGSVQYGSTGRGLEFTLEQAIDLKVGGWTDELIQKRAEAAREKLAATQKAWTTPETLEEFREFVRHHGRTGYSAEEKAKVEAMNRVDRERYFNQRGLARLSPEQRAMYDDLAATVSRAQRVQAAPVAEQAAAPVAATEGSMQVQETTHTKLGHKLWVVTLKDRVEREAFEKLRERAQQLGGYYSSFRGNGAIPGFTFKDSQAATSFMTGEARQVVAGAAPEPTREERVAEKLAEAGERAIAQAEDSLGGSRKMNTARRVRMGDAAAQRAQTLKREGQTAVQLATALANGELRYLNKIAGFVKPVREIESLLRRAQSNRIRFDQANRGMSDYQAHDANELPTLKRPCGAVSGVSQA